MGVECGTSRLARDPTHMTDDMSDEQALATIRSIAEGLPGWDEDAS